jgi:anti-anti-sigma factor
MLAFSRQDRHDRHGHRRTGLAAVPDLDTQLRAAERDTPLVVLDLRALEFVDSSGAALMLATDRRVSHAGGRFVVVRGRSRSSGYSR